MDCLHEKKIARLKNRLKEKEAAMSSKSVLLWVSLYICFYLKRLQNWLSSKLILIVYILHFILKSTFFYVKTAILLLNKNTCKIFDLILAVFFANQDYIIKIDSNPIWMSLSTFLKQSILFAKFMLRRQTWHHQRSKK